MAKAVGLDADEWVLRVQADRESTVNPKRAQVWLRCASRISGTAAAIAMMIMAATPAHADTVISVHNNDHAVYYV